MKFLAIEQGIRLHRSMVRIRLFEERAADLLEAGEIRCPTHLYTGQEAVAAGVCAALEPSDYVLGNHRSHGHYLAKGGDPKALMAELFCRRDGCAGGRGGSMHIIDLDHGLLGTVPMVAATIPVAVGAALASTLRGDRRVTVSFFGDSATEEGVFHESVNFAALHKLPVVFVCENNLYSSHLHIRRRRTTEDLSALVAGYGIPTRRVDGNDAEQVLHAAQQAVARARKGDGATFLEFTTYRWRGHVGPKLDLGLGIRDESELEFWRTRDPISRLASSLVRLDASLGAALQRNWSDETALVEESVQFARTSPQPDPAGVLHHVYHGGSPKD